MSNRYLFFTDLYLLGAPHIIIPNRSTGCLDKSPGGGYIRFREPGATVTNMIYNRNRPSKLGGASIRRGAFIGDYTVTTWQNAKFQTFCLKF